MKISMCGEWRAICAARERVARELDAYNAMLRDELLLPFSGDDIERMAKRIAKLEQKLGPQ